MFVALLRAMRPHQWVKNLFVLAPLLFAKELFEPTLIWLALQAFVSFCALSSAVYILNDLADVEADRAHPVKRFRPIAHGTLPLATAKISALMLCVLALGLALFTHRFFALCILGYGVLNVAYTFRLKKIAYVDVLCIALGFELRVFGGALAIGVPASVYLLIVTLLLSAFLGFGKRLHELKQLETRQESRPSLRGYNEHMLRRLVLSFGLATCLIYMVYTLDPHTRIFFGTDYLALSSLFVGFGVIRFFSLIQSQRRQDSPTEEMLRDMPFLANLGAWAVTIIAIIYFR